MVNYVIIDTTDGKEHVLKSDDNDEMLDEATNILKDKYHKSEEFIVTYKIKDVDTGEVTGKGSALVPRGFLN